MSRFPMGPASAAKPEIDWVHDPLRIFAIGGGTGLSTLLKGLKRYAHQAGAAALEPYVDITAMVTVTDDGGSSGRLRREFEMLPPGDVRNCMVALSEDEALLARLFQYRFSSGRGLKGHSFGNLFLTALTQITGDFARAVELSSAVLAIAGRIFPSTRQNVSLRAHLADGRIVDGETSISRSDAPIARIELVPPDVRPTRGILDAIARADLITLGPGSLFTSVIPNLLVRGVAAAIRRSPAWKACIVNLMWQPGETLGMSAADHIEAIYRHAGAPLLQFAIVNTQPIARARLARYARARARQVTVDQERLEQLGLQVLGLPLLARGEKIRHDPERTAAAVIDLALHSRRQRVILARPARRRA
ncbi:MAG: gluconeogenesis factor YvcK family protein [Bryobacteraceae bacterium]